MGASPLNLQPKATIFPRTFEHETQTTERKNPMNPIRFNIFRFLLTGLFVAIVLVWMAGDFFLIGLDMFHWPYFIIVWLIATSWVLSILHK